VWASAVACCCYARNIDKDRHLNLRFESSRSRRVSTVEELRCGRPMFELATLGIASVLPISLPEEEEEA
jgi:hypothetical protein